MLRIAKHITGAKIVSVCIITVSLLMFFIFPGCREQQPMTPPAQADLTGQVTIRVLLSNDIKSCTINSPSSFRVADGRTGITELWIEKPDSDIQVRIDSGKIHMADKVFSNQSLKIEPNQFSEFSMSFFLKYR